MHCNLFRAVIPGLLVAAMAFLSPQSHAQMTGPPKTAPPAEMPSAESDAKPSDVPLSKKLDEGEGVLKPPAGIDPKIDKVPSANTDDKMPVIVPPGEPGGDQSVQPK